MGSYNFGNTKHGFDDYENGNPAFSSSSARHRFADNPFYDTGQNEYVNITIANSGSYDGEGVDIIIVDDGLDHTHPEFFDTDGNTRIVAQNWHQYGSATWKTNQGTTTPSGWYTNTHRRHGTMCASAAAGIKHGYAKGATIYDLPIGSSQSHLSYNSRRAYPDIREALTMIKNWKNARTGSDANRPVIVSASWGAGARILPLARIDRLYYKGQWNAVKAGTGPDIWGNWEAEELLEGGIYTWLQETGLSYNNYYQCYNVMFPWKGFTSYDSEITALLDLGIHYVTSAGNRGTHQAKSTDTHYNNFARYTGSTTGQYISRRVVDDDRAILVGAAMSREYQSSQTTTDNNSDLPSWLQMTNGEDQKSGYSAYGSGVDVYAVADRNWTAYPTNFALSDTLPKRDYKTYDGNTNSSFQESFRLGGGTSYACPNAVGLLATYLEQYPSKTPAQAKSGFLGMGLTGKMNHITPDDITTNISDFQDYFDAYYSTPTATGISVDTLIGVERNFRKAVVSTTAPVIAHNTALALTTSTQDTSVDTTTEEQIISDETTPEEEVFATDFELRGVKLKGVNIG